MNIDQLFKHFKIENPSGGYFATNIQINGAKATTARLNVDAQSETFGWVTKDTKKDGGNNFGNYRRDRDCLEVKEYSKLYHQTELGLVRDNFQIIRELLHEGTEVTSFGRMARDSQDLRKFLEKLHQSADEICDERGKLINAVNGTNPDTPIFKLYLEKTSRTLCCDTKISDDGKRTLKAFCESRNQLENLPELLGFEGGVRGGNLPEKAPWTNRFRHYLEQIKNQNGNSPLGDLHYVAYELKPMRITGMNYGGAPDDVRKADDRRDHRLRSMDLLLKYEDNAVLTEVKMVGDGNSFSHPLVQLLYYTCFLTCKNQRNRLKRHYKVDGNKLWLCLILEDRDVPQHDKKNYREYPTDNKLRAYKEDKKQVLKFLNHSNVQEQLKAYFCGIFILTITETEDSKKDNYAWKVKEEIKIPFE
ncbi:hypothetical protein N9B53_03930 [Mariniblastus sp.]|nr:hypothetical protein [Mariniblastus sp.]